jgi:hypothetical protein
MLYQSRHLEHLPMVFFHIRETEQSVAFQRILHNAQKYGKSNGVDELNISKIDDQLFRSFVDKLFTRRCEIFCPDGIDISLGHHDSDVLF